MGQWLWPHKKSKSNVGTLVAWLNLRFLRILNFFVIQGLVRRLVLARLMLDIHQQL